MNDTSNDGTESTDPTEGILADLANLQQTVSAKNAEHDDVDDTVRARLDDIAEAAESLRIGDADDDGDADEPAPRRGGPKSAREAVANRGLVFEEFVRSDSSDDSDDDSDGSGDSDDRDSDDGDSGRAPETAQASPSFDPRNPFAAPAPPVAAPEPRTAPAVPYDGGLIFQVPKAEHAEVVTIEDDSDADWDDSRDSDDDSSSPQENRQNDNDEDESAGGPRRRRGGRGRRSRNRDDSHDDSADSADDSKDSEDETSDAAEGQSSKSSKRGSRSNRRGSKQSSDADGDDSQSKSDHKDSDHKDSDDSHSDEDDDDSDSGSRRRRRRRSRTRSTDRDEVTSLKGSTRLEAKRQRRKEGREAGRRRPIITEAEFLARRESVDRTMLVRESGDQTQLVVVEDGIAVEHYLKENRQQSSLIGNVYLGKVQNVLPSMEAAFIDIGKGRNAVLYAGEVNWDALGMDGKARRIETALSPGDAVLVQVTKDPIGHKGARLTGQISLPGRFLVYVPGNSMTGISRKLPDNERARLKKLLKQLVGDSNGVIVRTAAEGATDSDLSRDVERLAKRWETIEKKSKSTKVLAPQLLYSEPDMIVRIIRDVFNEDFSSLVIDGDSAWDTIHEYVESVAPDLLERVHSYNEDEDIFDHYRIEEQIQKALQRTVSLPSGGSLVIDRTEAMTVVDVNTGKFTGSGGNLEETVTRNNLEAAEEVIRQIRLRDIGGIIVVDFIDMVLESNRDLVVRRLVECLGRDRTKHQVAEVTSLGLVQMTRKRIGTGLAESLVSAGEDLTGRGLLLPGSEEDGSKAHRGNRSNHDNRRDRKRRSDSGSKAKHNESESTEETVSSDASRSAVAAIAKATLKKDDTESAESTTSDASSQSADSSSSDETGKSRSRSRNGRRRSRSDRNDDSQSEKTDEKSNADKSSSDEQAPAAERKPAPDTKPAAEEPQDLPLMIGADSETKVAAAAPVKAAPAKKSESVKKSPAPKQEQLPTSFVIIGQD